MDDLHPAIAAGVCSTREECELLEAQAARMTAEIGKAVGVDDLIAAIRVADDALTTLDRLGLRVRAPEVPEPDPDPTVYAKLCRMYGAFADPVRPRRREAARRTAVAMERRRQGWTRAGARAEWQQRTMQAIEGAIA